MPIPPTTRVEPMGIPRDEGCLCVSRTRALPISPSSCSDPFESPFDSPDDRPESVGQNAHSVLHSGERDGQVSEETCPRLSDRISF